MRKALKDTDKILLFITIVLSLFGLFNIVTASSREAVINLDQSIYYYFYRHLIILIIALFASLVVIKIPLKKYYSTFYAAVQSYAVSFLRRNQSPTSGHARVARLPHAVWSAGSAARGRG